MSESVAILGHECDRSLLPLDGVVSVQAAIQSAGLCGSRTRLNPATKAVARALTSVVNTNAATAAVSPSTGPDGSRICKPPVALNANDAAPFLDMILEASGSRSTRRVRRGKALGEGLKAAVKEPLAESMLSRLNGIAPGGATGAPLAGSVLLKDAAAAVAEEACEAAADANSVVSADVKRADAPAKVAAESSAAEASSHAVDLDEPRITYEPLLPKLAYASPNLCAVTAVLSPSLDTPIATHLLPIGILTVEPCIDGHGIPRYTIHCVQGNRRWMVDRRYREWNALRCGLGPNLTAPFPPKRPHGLLAALCRGGRTHPSMLEKRALALHCWMCELLAHSWALHSAEVGVFLRTGIPRD